MKYDRFMEEVDKEISEMKLSLNARARIVAESYLTAVRHFLITLNTVLIPFLAVQRLTPLDSLDQHPCNFFISYPTNLCKFHGRELPVCNCKCNPVVLDTAKPDS